jgi:hypothetical protein
MKNHLTDIFVSEWGKGCKSIPVYELKKRCYKEVLI